jgi:phage-related protein
MYFTIPDSFTGNGALQVDIDRKPTLDNEINTHLFQDTMGYPLEQSRPDGINTTKSTTQFTIKNILASTAKTIDLYFESLTGPITVVFPDESKEVFITEWSISRIHSTYSSVSVKGRIVT